jgi:transcription termination factor Rho
MNNHDITNEMNQGGTSQGQQNSPNPSMQENQPEQQNQQEQTNVSTSSQSQLQSESPQMPPMTQTQTQTQTQSQNQAQNQDQDQPQRPQAQSNAQPRSQNKAQGQNQSQSQSQSQANHVQPTQAPQHVHNPVIINLNELKKKNISELTDLAYNMRLENMARAKKQEIIYAILRAHLDNGDKIHGEGVLQVLPDGYGFLRFSDNYYEASLDDLYVSPALIRRYHLRTGDSIFGEIRPPKANERYFALHRIESVNFDEPEQAKNKISFENLTPLFAKERLRMEIGNGSKDDISARIIDLASPIGKGQRGLIVAQPKVGKTVLLQNIASSIATNYPECYLIVLLIDERPEEVTEMIRTVRGEVVASNFDEPASRQVELAEIVIEKAKRLVEHRHDVVILLDSITRLARAYNTLMPASGKILTGGVDANALQRPKRFFGAARNTEEAGSLTIIATALIDTGSKMDEVIFEEFKGTGNMELYLDRKLAEKRIYPAIHFSKSGTRREDLITTPEELQRLWILRKILHPMNELSAMEFLVDHLKDSETNEQFFKAMKKQS